LDVPISEQGFRGGPIEIGEDCWIGRGVIVTGNVKVGRGSVIGANAVVTRDIPEYSVAVGVPAKVIKNRRGDGSKIEAGM
jgi:acetyltransferase-like isoleucine patch superfamily enzyme